MKEKVKLKKSGGFFQTIGDDCYILYYLFGYKIVNGKTGFPLSVFHKVINTLNDAKISYEVIDKKQDYRDMKNFKGHNNYTKYCEAGKNKYQKELEKENLFQKIRDLPEEKVNRIYDVVLSIMNE